MSDDQWAFVAPSLTLLDEEGLQRRSPLREVFTALRWIVRAGAPGRLLPPNVPPWPTVYPQARRGLAAGCFEALVPDLRRLLRLAKGRAGPPWAAIFEARVIQSSPESGAWAGDDGHKRRTGSKRHQAVDTLGSLLALAVTPASADVRTQVAELAAQVQEVTGEHVEWA